MSKPKKDLQSSSSKNIQIPEHFLKDLLTASEIRMLKNRWQITSLLKTGLSIRKIASQLKVGTDTVVRTIRMVERNNLLSKTNQNVRKFKSQTPWIFGKSS